MRERGMIFNADMVRAVLNGSKTQTRRIIQSAAKNMQARGHEVISHRAPGDKWYGDYVYSMRDRSGVWQDFTNEQFLAKCPFGQPGDRLWVRETWSTDFANYYPNDRVWYAADDNRRLDIEVVDGVRGIYSPESDVYVPFRWRPSIHMPRWASRITLEITGVRVERLQDISQADAKAEGCWYGRGGGEPDFAVSPADHFPTLWESIYGEESWQANPWVWVIEFKRVEGE